MTTTPDHLAAISEAEISQLHEGGKLSVELKHPLETKRDLSIADTPGVAQVSRAIAEDPAIAKTHTSASRLVAVISDGSSVLGLGNIGPSDSLPVMEGKSALFKNFGGLDSIPILLDTGDVDEIVDTVVRIAPSFGAVNLEDISAPRYFEIEQRLIEALDMSIMHDDQHGTAVVVLAALINAVKVVGKQLEQLKVVISGAAGVAVTDILHAVGVRDVVVLDSRGIISTGRDNLPQHKAELAIRTNPRGLQGGTADALDGTDALIGLSSASRRARSSSRLPAP